MCHRIGFGIWQLKQIPGISCVPSNWRKLWAECVTRLNLNIEKKNTNGYGHSWLPKIETIYDSKCHSISCPKPASGSLLRSWFFWWWHDHKSEIFRVNMVNQHMEKPWFLWKLMVSPTFMVGFPGFPPHLPPMSKAEASPRSPASAKAALTAELPWRNVSGHYVTAS